MNAERLLKHYERIADAPDAIPRLRQFILDLAVRGKLVPQDSNDEPIPCLAASTEPPHPAVPRSWSYRPLVDLLDGETRNGYSRRPDDPVAGTPILRISAGTARSDGIVAEEEHKLISGIGPELRAQYGLKLGDLLACRFNGNKAFVGRLTIFTDYLGIQPIYPDKLIRVRVALALVVPEFLRLAGESDLVRAEIESRCATTVGNWGISASSLKEVKFPLPPLGEQRRIIMKVDELMASCDRLEIARKGRDAMRDRLAAASMARLHVPGTDPVTFAKHARFVVKNLDALTHRPDEIQSLRQAVLGLAVCGKLPLQNAKDEPGSDLLERIRRARRRRRNLAQLDTATLDMPRPLLPATWAWSVVDQIASDEDDAITDGPFGAQLKTEHYVSAPGFRVIRLQNIGLGVFRDDHRTYIDRARFDRLAKHHVAGGDLVVAGLVDPRVRCCQLPLDIGPAVVKADCYRFSVHPLMASRFALYYLNSPTAQELAAAHHHGMTLTRIGLGNFRRIPFPVPPLAEQHRIVAKVDELMALCDQLEASLISGEDTRCRLLDALLAEALAPATTEVA